MLCGNIAKASDATRIDTENVSNMPDLSNMSLIVIGGLVVLIAGVFLVRKIVRLRHVIRSGYAGSQLQTQVIRTFTLVTIIPTIVISVFSILFFYYGIKDWFNQSITTVLEESVAVAEAYLDEHESTLRVDALGMAEELTRNLDFSITNPVLFSNIVDEQVTLRSLSEAIVIQNERVLARSRLSFSLSFESLPERAFHAARKGKIALVEKHNRIFAVVNMDPLTNTFLIISRLVDEKVLEHIEQSKGAATNYERLTNNINQLQVIFVVVFILVTLILLLTVFWYGVSFAARITNPLITVAQATERVRAGDYSIQIEENTNNEEIDLLIRHFNRMTGQLYHQRLELTQVTRMLDQRRRFSETVLSGVSAGVIALDTTFIVGLCNASAVRLLHFESPQEMAGHPLRVLVPELEPLLARVLQRPGMVQEDQVTIIRHGQTIEFQVKVSAEISQSYIEGFIVTIDDITPLIAAQRNAAWSDVARRVAHEIKNPLTPIKLSVERLRKKFHPEDSAQQESFDRYLNTITRHLTDIGTIVEEFASFARMPAPKLQPVVLKPLLDGAIFSAETSEPDIEYVLDSEQDITLNCDEGLMSQLLTNLLKNAAESIGRRDEEATHEAGWIHMGAYSQGEHIIIAIADNGVGFPEHLIHRVMEPYVTTRAKGTGLGLAIVRKIVEDHHGTISLNNRSNGGAVIRLSFPRHIAIDEKNG